MINGSKTYFCLLVLFFGLKPLCNAVPMLISFQGHVLDDGRPFEGTGQFKFAIVNQGGATLWGNDELTTNGEPTKSLGIQVVRGVFATTLGDDSITNMAVLSPGLFDHDFISIRIWFDAGDGVFDLLSPDIRITAVGFALKAKTVDELPDGIVTEATLGEGLRDVIELNSAKTGITSAQADAINANTAKTGITSVQVDATTANTAKLDALQDVIDLNTAKTGITSAQVDATTANTAKLDALQDVIDLNTAKTGITSAQVDAINANTAKLDALQAQITTLEAAIGTTAEGTLVSSASSEDSTLTGSGYIKFLSIAADSWSASPGTELLSGRVGQGSAWTGSTMAIWGGNLASGTYLSTGATYDPATDSWAAITPLDAPASRSGHSAVWTGSDFIVWGGYGAVGTLNNGGRYQVSTQSWLPLADTGAPAARYANAAIWTGARMLVWGGHNNTGILNDGALYDPASDSWSALGLSGAPAARYSAASVLAGDTVLVWGGQGATGALGDGASLALTSGVPSAWSAITTTGAPSARSGHAAAWTGSKLIVWGGIQGGTYLNDGGIYDPAVGQGGTWAAMSTTGAPAARENHAAVWTGSELVVIGGEGVSGSLADSHAYNPATDTWRSLSGSTGARSGSSSEWTGSQILIFGGESDGQVIGQPMEIDPAPPVHLYRKQ